MPRLIKGQSGNPTGKPKGARDRKWASIDYWMRLIQRNWPKLKPEEQTKIALEMIRLILPRRPLPPEPQRPQLSPEEADRLIAELENNYRPLG